MSRYGDGISDKDRAKLTVAERAAAISHGPLTCRYLEEGWDGYTGELCADCKYVIGHIGEAIAASASALADALLALYNMDNEETAHFDFTPEYAGALAAARVALRAAGRLP